MAVVDEVKGQGALRVAFRRLALAIQFLTRVPVRIGGSVAPRELASALAFYPPVGLLVGAVAAGVGVALAPVVSSPAAALAAVATMIMITGNLHLDGLMDTADGIYGAYQPERRLEIMKDSRMGAHGVVAAILAVGFKVTLLAEIPVQDWWLALPLACVAGRWTLVHGVCRYPHARPEGLGRTLAEHARPVHYGVAGASALLFAAVLAPGAVHFGAVVLLVPALTAAAGAYLRGKLGGMTGDTLGALNEVAETFVLFLFVAVAGRW